MIEQWIKNAESRGSIEGLAKDICSLIETNIHVLNARIAGCDHSRVMAARGAHTIGSIDLAIAGLQRLKVLLAEETGCPTRLTD